MAIPTARAWRILWPSKAERRSLAFLGVDPRAPTVRFDDLAHDGESHARALDAVTRVERLEQTPDLRVIAPRDSGAVVAHEELPAIANGLGADLHERSRLRVVLDRVGDQV